MLFYFGKIIITRKGCYNKNQQPHYYIDQMKRNTGLDAYKKEVRDSVRVTRDRIEKELRERSYVDFQRYPQQKIKRELTACMRQISELQNIDAEKLELKIPPPHIACDFTIEAFNIVRIYTVRMSAAEMAQKIEHVINSGSRTLIKRATAIGNFVNLELRKEAMYHATLSVIAETGERYGESNINAKKIAVFDYSAPNIGKPIGIGHLRSTIIGQALSNVYWKTGYSVVRDNHLGDGGTQFGALAYAYQHWKKDEKDPERPLQEFKELYVRFTEEARAKPELKKEASELFRKLEEGDSFMLQFWKKVWDLSVQELHVLYDLLGVAFDTCIGESYFTEQAKETVEECLKKGMCHVEPETGAVVVESIPKLPSFLLRKGVGSTLYITRDLATMKFRVETFHPNSILYVVDKGQELHFQQLFALCKKMGYLPSAVDAKHIKFGMVTVEGKKMSTRGGTLIELEEVLEKSIDTSRQIIHKKNSSLSLREIEAIATVVGVGAIVYNDLRQSKIKNISFDWERMLNLEGGSAVYLQYTYVRILSILQNLEQGISREVSIIEKEVPEEIIFEKESEFLLAKELMMFPECIAQSQRTDSPHHICMYLEGLARQFNSFYNEVSIIRTERGTLKESRVLLIKAVALVIKNGLSLLSIKVPNKM